jgi:TolB protein
VVAPADAQVPVSYSWQATGQAPQIRDGGLSDAASFTWTTAGRQTITVEATNQCGHVVSDTWTYDATYKNMIAYERRSGGADTHDIFVMYQDGRLVENLTNSPDWDDGTPTWSPDGNQIAFTSRPDGGNGAPRIMKIDLRTRVVTQLTDGTFNDRWPTWSPDGTQIAFMRRLPPKQIFVMNADGSNPQNLTNSGYSDEWPVWSWDGDWIAFVSTRYFISGDDQGRDLWIVNVDNPTDQRNVLRTDKQPGFANEELYPTWSPDGRIYYSYAPNATEPQQLYRIWPDGSGREKVFPADTYERTIASFKPPDGQGCFVFYGYLGQGDKEVWRWCNGYSTPVNLTNNVDIDDEFCAWSPVP